MSFARTVLGMVLCCASFVASAQWPDKPIRFVVPYPPGAMGDVVARLLSQELADKLGQPVLIDNKPGAGGNIGAAAVVRAAPDGYSFLVAATNNLVINQYLFKNLGFDPLKALEPVTMLVDVPSVVFVNSAVPAKTFGELVTYARNNVGKVNYGSPGNGTAPHLTVSSINRALRTQMTHVPYQGAAPGVQALLAGDIQVYLGGAGLGLAYVQAGKLRALAVSSSARLAVLPGTPTFDEVGMPQAMTGNWWAIAAPRGTPRPVIDRLAAEISDALQQPKLRSRLVELGVLPIAAGPQAMGKRLAEESGRWRQTVVDSGVTID